MDGPASAFPAHRTGTAPSARKPSWRSAACSWCSTCWPTCFGNLKIFFGPATFDGYAHWLRTIGEPVCTTSWTLWVIRVVLVAAVVAHVVSAYQLSRRDIRARPVKYVHRKAGSSYATRTMRWGGIILRCSSSGTCST